MKRTYRLGLSVSIFGMALSSLGLLHCVADPDPITSSENDAGNSDGSAIDGNVGDGGPQEDGSITTPATGKYLWRKAWNVEPFGLATDSANATYVGLALDGQPTQIDDVTLDPDAGQVSLGLAKLKPDGSLAFAKGFPGGIVGAANGLAVGSDGSIYVAGMLDNTTVDFGNGVKVTGAPTGSTYYGFLVKLDATGTGVWARTMSSPQSTTLTESFDGNINRGCYPAVSGSVVALACTFDGLTFAYGNGDGSGQTMFASNLDNAVPTGAARDSSSRAYMDWAIAAFDTSGTFKWGDAIGTVAPNKNDPGDRLLSLTGDPTGGFVLSGWVGGDASVIDSLGHISVARVGSNSRMQAFFARLNAADGTATTNGLIGDMAANAMQVDNHAETDPSGASTTIAGKFVQNVNINGSEITSVGNSDGYCMRINTASRAVQFSALVVGDNADEARGAASNAAGQTVCMGISTANAKVGGQAISSPPGAGQGMFISKFASDGGVLWSNGIAGISDSDIASPVFLALTPNGETRIVGTWGGSLPFDGVTQTLADAGPSNGEVTFVAAYAP